MKYDAFISYRHTPLDMETAKKVHTFLETYHVPGAVQKKTGKKKINRVFRDQEELPIGSDLNDNISEALKESEYLIVICSPDTPGSYWVNKEIDTFIELHDRSHVLAVLAAGEPDQSFPPQLLVDDEGKPVEPLAADVRGETQKERNVRFKTEMLRLAAPVLGCTYDDLKQRHRERIIRRNIAIASSIAVVIAAIGIAFGIYNARVADKMKKLADEKAELADEKTVLADEKSKLAEEKGALAEEKSELLDSLTEEYIDKQKNQSRFYAEEALNILKQGKRGDAARIAAAGLPGEDNERPYVAEAEYALSAALHAYDFGKTLNFDNVLEHELSVKYQNFTDDGQLLTTIDSGETVYVWDTADNKLLAKIPCDINEDYYLITALAAAADKANIYVATKESLCCYDYDGGLRHEYIYPADITGAIISLENDRAFLISAQTLEIVSLSDGKVQKTINNTSEYSFSSLSAVTEDGKYIAVGHLALMETEGIVTLVNLEDYSVQDIKLTNPHPLDLCFTPGDMLCVLSCNEDFISSGVKKLSMDIQTTGEEGFLSVDVPVDIYDIASFDSVLKSAKSPEGDYIVLAIESEAFAFDTAGKLISYFTLGGSTRTLHLAYESGIGWVSYANGDIVTINFIDQKIYSDNAISTGLEIREMEMIDGGVAIAPIYSSNVYVMKYHIASDLETLTAQNDYSLLCYAAPDGSYFVMDNGFNRKEILFYDNNGELIYSYEDDRTALTGAFIDNKFIFTGYQRLCIIDPIKKEIQKYEYADFGLNSSAAAAYFTEDSHYAVIYATYSLIVLDMENMKCIYSLDNGKKINGSVISNDGKTLLLSCADKNLTKIDIETKKETVLENDSLRVLMNLSASKFLAISKSGKLCAMACSDGKVRLIDLNDGKIVQEIPMNSHVRCFVRFTSDEKHLILQGDDYTIKIWDIDKKLVVSSTGCNMILDHIIEDPDGYLAMSTPYFAGLFETTDYAMVAYAQYGFCYVPADKSFLIQDGKNVYRTHYKNYEKLIEEAKRQFGSLEFDAEQKLKYNIS